MGYAKINKDKIQPSPALAALTGFLSGLNTKKKELQDREDAQNKADMELGKWMKAFGLQERETEVKERGADVAERGADVAEQTLSMNIEDKLAQLGLARERIDIEHEEVNIKKNEYLDKVEQRAQDLDVNSLSNRVKIYMAQELEDIKTINKIGELQAEAELKFGDRSKWKVLGTEEFMNKLKYANEVAIEDVKQRGREKIAGMEITGREKTTGMGISADVNLESIKQKGRKELAVFKGETESADPKIKNFISIQKSNQGFFGTVLTSPNKIVDDLTAKYMTDRSQMEMDAWHELTSEQQKGLTAPVPVTMSKQAKGGWNILGWQTKITAKPTEMLVGSDAINFRQFTTREAREDMLSKYPNKNEALAHLIDLGVTEVAGQSIVDEVYKKK